MVLDPASRCIFLFGGWDGRRDLSDLWRYDLEEDRWARLSADAEADGGPSPRSCHKMALDAQHGNIFVLVSCFQCSFSFMRRGTNRDFEENALGRSRLSTFDSGCSPFASTLNLFPIIVMVMRSCFIILP